MGIEEILQRDSKYKYMLLGRMQSDCEYYLASVIGISPVYGLATKKSR